MTDTTANEPIDNTRRRFLTTAATVVGGSGLVAGAIPFITSWNPSERTRAVGAPVEVDVSKLAPGELLIVEWQGKPIWILRRDATMISDLEKSTEDDLRDPQSEKPQQPDYAQNKTRARNPEYFVVIGICTHLGCSPAFATKQDSHSLGDTWKGGFFCACHGSRFDLAGRVFKGVPAPSNLVIPPYQFLDAHRILIGDDSELA